MFTKYDFNLNPSEDRLFTTQNFNNGTFALFVTEQDSVSSGHELCILSVPVEGMPYPVVQNIDDQRLLY